MIAIQPWITNSFWQFTAYPAWVAFQRSKRRVYETQEVKLQRYLIENQNTYYGKRYGFAGIKDISTYQQRVPLTTYDDYADEIEKIGAGKSDILTVSPVRIFELSSGSTAPSKLIPYTNQLRREFQAGISAWIVDLFQANPYLKRGTAYWSISPLLEGRKHTSGGIPIGFEEDSAYLGGLGKILAGSIFAVPNEVKSIRDIENFRYVTCLFLLANRQLRLISIWNPTFLSLLLACMLQWWEPLLADIKAGSLRPPTPMDGVLQRKLSGHLRPSPDRADQLTKMGSQDFNQIWPDLQLVSCWMEGPSGIFVDELRDLLPRVPFQPKGLIATEAFVSFPMMNLSGSALAVTSHFFEFLPIGGGSLQANENDPHLAHELETGNKYSVVITTGGGFYRYLLQDMVEVVGHFHQVPLIRFVSKMNRISDWFGEKLNEFFVASSLEELFLSSRLQPAFSMLAPNDRDGYFRYTLYLELSPKHHRYLNEEKIATRLDHKLRRNFHYDYCRRLGQISQPDLFLMNTGARGAYLAAKQEKGQKMGDIKPVCLEATAGWGHVFDPYRSTLGVSTPSFYSRI